jgi:hypothetical protein
MKKIISALAVLLMLLSCAQKPVVQPLENSVVYEMNVRQYTPEGTFAAAQKQLPRLKDLGVDILWLMPIHPIGVEGRKGSLGSYYAIKDYKAVNPEFGTMKEFEDFLAQAHRLGFRVVLDCVANHTSPDAVWTTERAPEWYERDSTGKTTYTADWSDTANLNYANKDVWEGMADAMRFWMEKGVDGFRCDAGYMLPVEAWKYIEAKVRSEYPDTVFMLEKWREKGIIDKIIDAYNRGVIICGLSAGAICWFEDMYTDSATATGGSQDYAFYKGLGVLNGLACPHYNLRKEEFDFSLKNSEFLSAYAIEDNSAIVFIDGKFNKSISVDGNSYLITNGKGEISHTLLK